MMILAVLKPTKESAKDRNFIFSRRVNNHQPVTAVTVRLLSNSSILVFFSFLCASATLQDLHLLPINFPFIHCITYKFYSGLQLGMHNSQFEFSFKFHPIKGNSWTITKIRDLCKPILACFCEIAI